MAHADEWLGSLARAIARVGNRHPVILLALALVVGAGSVAYSTLNLRFLTNRNDMISPSKEVQRRWKDHLSRMGTEDDMVVVFAGNNEPTLRPAVEDLARQLRNEPARFRRVWHEADLRALADRSLQLAPPEKLQAVLGQVRSMRPLLELPLAWNLFTLQNLVFETRLRLKGATAEADMARRDKATRKPGAEADATVLEGFARVLEAAAEAMATGKAGGSPWAPVDEDPRASRLLKPSLLTAPGGELAFVLASPVPDESNKLDANKASVVRLREIVAEVQKRHPALEMGVTGLPVLEYDEMEASQADTTRSSWLAFGGVLALFAVVFRTWRAPAICAAPLLVGTVMALGWATLTVGHLNLLSATFAVMLIGMGDYSVLYVSRYLEEIAGHAGHEDALEKTASSLGASIATAALTSSLAFMAAMLSDFQAVAELGWIAGWGLLFCAGAALLLVPALLALLRPGCQVPASLPAMPGRKRPALGPVMVLAALACGLGMCFLRYDHNLLKLQSPSLPSVAWEHRLLEATPGASWHALVWADTRDRALELKAGLEALPEVSMVTEVASLVSPVDEKATKAIVEIARLLDRLPAAGTRFKHPRPNPGQLGRELGLLRETLLAGPPPDEPILGRLLAASRGLETALAKAGPAAEANLGMFDDALAEGLLASLRELKSKAGTRPITLVDVPEAMRERHADAEGRFLLRVFAKAPLWESENLKGFNRAILSIAPGATGKPFTTWEGLVGMQAGFIRAGLLALVAIVAILAIDFRSISCVALALIPLLAGTAVSLGVFGWMGWALNPANMIALPLIVGVGVDNGVHVVHDWVSRRGRGAYHVEHGVARGILVAGLTTIIGFGALMTSGHRGLAGLGAILALGVGGSLGTALVILPWLLSLAGFRTALPEGAPAPEPPVPFPRAA